MKAIQRRGRGEVGDPRVRREHYKSVVHAFSCTNGKMKHVEESDHYMIYAYPRCINVVKYVPIFNPLLCLSFFVF